MFCNKNAMNNKRKKMVFWQNRSVVVKWFGVRLTENQLGEEPRLDSWWSQHIIRCPDGGVGVFRMMAELDVWHWAAPNYLIKWIKWTSGFPVLFFVFYHEPRQWNPPHSFYPVLLRSSLVAIDFNFTRRGAPSQYLQFVCSCIISRGPRAVTEENY